MAALRAKVFGAHVSAGPAPMPMLRAMRHLQSRIWARILLIAQFVSFPSA